MRDAVADRLKQARIGNGYRRAVEAAESLGIPYATYAAHENGSRKFDNEAAAQYAKRFRVSIDWLLTGRGDGPTSTIEESVPLMGYVGAGAEIEPDFEQVPDDGLEQIAVPIPLPDDMIAFQVRGDSMLPMFDDGMVIIVFREQRRSTDSFYGERVIVRTSDGRRYIKTLMRGDGGLVSLLSWNAKPIENVEVAWIGEIFTFFPASAIKREISKMARQGGLQGRLKLRA